MTLTNPLAQSKFKYPSEKVRVVANIIWIFIPTPQRMKPEVLLAHLISTVCFLVFLIDATSSASTPNNPRCQEKCGNITIPYPFGIGEGCYLEKAFEVACNRTSNSASLLSNDGNPLLHISLDYVRTTSEALPMCYERSGYVTYYFGDYGLNQHFSISRVHNKFVAIGCDIFAFVSDSMNPSYSIGCASLCDRFSNNSIGQVPSSPSNPYCQTPLAQNINSSDYYIRIYSMNTDSRQRTKNPCSFAFFAENNLSNFDHFDLSITSYISSPHIRGYHVPVMLDWKVGNTSCSEARKRKDYACRLNTKCVDFADSRGYKCYCKPGFQGNPYESDGCQDIDECEVLKKGICMENAICVNTEGSYYCTCPSGYHGNVTEDGFGCKPDKFPAKTVFLGVGIPIVVISLIPIGFCLYRNFERRKKIKLKQKFFKRNGGLLLQQHVSSSEGSLVKTKVFVAEELEKATENFNKSRVLGKGGLGTVYKGMLQDGSIVAVKKSNTINENQVDQFINEVSILSLIDHRNIVKLLGCCLETEVPLLVYGYVSNGTLSHHLHDKGNESTISWQNRLRIAGEVAGSLAYLHSYASTAIFHRDIKSSNILLDENYRAVVSDFGLSRSVPIEKTHLTTLVGGTFGYLDPEYFRSGQLTDKSDVYAFGVVLAELLTGAKAVSSDVSELGLVMHFRSSMKQNRLFEILDTIVEEEAPKEDVIVVAKLAKRCIKLNSKKRPSMKEVAADLERLFRKQIQPSNELICVDNDLSESECSDTHTIDGIDEDSSNTGHVLLNHTA